LYDADTQTDPSKDTNPSIDLKSESMDEIGPDKQKNVTVLFDVDKDTKYEINISPKSSDFEKDTEDVQVPLDTSKYNDSLKALQDPAKALKDRKSTRLNSSHVSISYAVFCLKKQK